MKNRLLMVFPLLLLSCEKSADQEPLPKPLEGASAQYTVSVEQDISVDDSIRIEKHRITGGYGYSVKITDNRYEIEIRTEPFYFDGKYFELSEMTDNNSVNFTIPVSYDIKKAAKEVLDIRRREFANPADPDQVFEKSLESIIPKVSNRKNKSSRMILEDTDEQITVSTTDSYSLPGIDGLEHNIECTDTSIEVISKENGLLISSEITSVSHGIIFTDENARPLTLTVKTSVKSVKTGSESLY